MRQKCHKKPYKLQASLIINLINLTGGNENVRNLRLREEKA